MKFPSEVINEIGYYVYLYIDPRDESIFYVGKGKGNRVFSHLRDKSESDKIKRITEIKAQRLEPRIEILVHGIENERTALRIESSIIDLIGIKNLSNKQYGYKSRTFGRMDVHQIVATYINEEVHVTEPSILIRINQAFRYTMTPAELYDYTRGQWKLDPNGRASRATYAFAVYQGIVQEVYIIHNWYNAGTTFSIRKGNENIHRGAEERVKGRYEFIGDIAPASVRSKYLNKYVGHYFNRGNSNPIFFVNMEKNIME